MPDYKTPPTPDNETGRQILRPLLKQRSLLVGLSAMNRHIGDVFQITMPGFKPVVLVGPEVNRQVLVTKREKFCWRNETDPVTKLLRHGVLVEDGDRHACLRSQMEPVLLKPQVLPHVEAMWHYTDQVMGAWEDGSTQDMLVEMRRMALLILMGTLFGVEFTPHLDRLWAAILHVIEYISPGLWIVWPDVPRPGYGRYIDQMDEYLYQIIRERRRRAEPGDDLLGVLVQNPDMNDGLIRDQLLTMLIAGHDTSTALLAWSLYLMGKHPAALARAQAEVDAVLGQADPTVDHVNQLTYLDWVMKEALRLYPPIHVGNRRTNSDVRVKGYDIPEDTRVMYSIYLSHRHHDYWQEPDHFHPERFERGRKQTPPAFTYLPFGGGPRNCIGAAYAQVEVKVVLARILQKMEMQLLPSSMKPYMGATLEPRPGVMMRVRRRDVPYVSI